MRELDFFSNDMLIYTLQRLLRFYLSVLFLFGSLGVIDSKLCGQNRGRRAELGSWRHQQTRTAFSGC